MEETVLKEGEAAAFELGMLRRPSRAPAADGKLKFRTSYGQNVLNHSKEVAYLAGIMAREVGLDAHVAVARRVPARHRQGHRPRDAGHAPRDRHRLAAQARRERAGGDGDGRASHGHRLAVARGDDRAGRRRDLRGAARARAATSSSRTSSASRSSKTSPTRSRACRRRSRCRPAARSASWSRASGSRDEEAVWLSKDIARRIENELEYPGQIKVTVIRETRAVEYAK